MFLGCHTPNTVVMAGLVPAIHVLKIKSWMLGTRPGMTDAK